MLLMILFSQEQDIYEIFLFWKEFIVHGLDQLKDCLNINFAKLCFFFNFYNQKNHKKKYQFFNWNNNIFRYMLKKKFLLRRNFQNMLIQYLLKGVDFF